jgi:hypothetical protein
VRLNVTDDVHGLPGTAFELGERIVLVAQIHQRFAARRFMLVFL